MFYNLCLECFVHFVLRLLGLAFCFGRQSEVRFVKAPDIPPLNSNNAAGERKTSGATQTKKTPETHRTPAAAGAQRGGARRSKKRAGNH